jgi:8-oxo-dGTP pyrophosphatase MutT (NUDIX family)
MGGPTTWWSGRAATRSHTFHAQTQKQAHLWARQSTPVSSKQKNMPWPAYCCLILRTVDGHFLLERRPEPEHLRIGGLTCLGGGREPDESPEDCLRRELREEVAWVPSAFQPALTFTVAGQLVAWFYTATLPPGLDLSHQEPGHSLELVPPEAATGPRISRWHRAVLDAYLQGQSQVHLDA